MQHLPIARKRKRVWGSSTLSLITWEPQTAKIPPTGIFQLPNRFLSASLFRFFLLSQTPPSWRLFAHPSQFRVDCDRCSDVRVVCCCCCCCELILLLACAPIFSPLSFLLLLVFCCRLLLAKRMLLLLAEEEAETATATTKNTERGRHSTHTRAFAVGNAWHFPLFFSPFCCCVLFFCCAVCVSPTTFDPLAAAYQIQGAAVWCRKLIEILGAVENLT